MKFFRNSLYRTACKKYLCSLFAFLILPIYAVNPDYGDPYCNKECESCKNTANSAEEHCASIDSLSLGIKVGVARNDRPASFLAMSRYGAVEGYIRGNMQDFDGLMSETYGSGPLNIEGVYLQLDVPEIDAAVYDPATLTLMTTAEFERIKADGHIKQIKSDNAFTHIEKLEAPAIGFHVRVWNLENINLVKSGTLYTVPTSVAPITETIFRKPPSATADNELFLTSISRFGINGVHETTQHFVRDTTQDSLEVTTYDGADASGDVIHKQTLQ